VKNTNRTRLACATDGRTYVICGHVVGSAEEIAAPRTNSIVPPVVM